MTIASDCSGVIPSIFDGSLCKNGMIIREIRDFKLSLSKVDFRFEGSESNGNAHSVSRFSLDLAPGLHVWFLERPGFLKLYY